MNVPEKNAQPVGITCVDDESDDDGDYKKPAAPHVLERWMSRDDWHVVERSLGYIWCGNESDFSKLFVESHVEIELGLEATFANRPSNSRQKSHGDDCSYASSVSSDYRMYDSDSEESAATKMSENTADDFFDQEEPSECYYTFAFRGITTGIDVRFSVPFRAMRLRSILLSRLIHQCKSPRQITVSGAAHCINGVHSSRAYSEDLRDLPDSTMLDSFCDQEASLRVWCNVQEILLEFSLAGHWVSSLERLDILSDTSGWESHADEEGIDNSCHYPFLATSPAKLKYIRCVAPYWIRDFVKHVPALEYLIVEGGHFSYDFFRKLEDTNSNLVNIGCKGEFILDGAGTATLPKALKTLKLLPFLKSVSLEFDAISILKPYNLEWLSKKEKNEILEEIQCFVRGFVGILSETSIQNISLAGTPALGGACMETLGEYLADPNCPLQYLDVNVGFNKSPVDGLVDILLDSSRLKNIDMVSRGDCFRTFDFLVEMRRFRKALSLPTHEVAVAWPSILEAAGRRKGPKEKTSSMRWFFTPKALSQSIVYTLLRERIGALCDGWEMKTSDTSNMDYTIAASSDGDKDVTCI